MTIYIFIVLIKEINKNDDVVSANTSTNIIENQLLSFLSDTTKQLIASIIYAENCVIFIKKTKQEISLLSNKEDV